MKKWIAMLLALTLAAGMTACGGAPAETPKTTDPAQPQEEVTQRAGGGQVSADPRRGLRPCGSAGGRLRL